MINLGGPFINPIMAFNHVQEVDASPLAELAKSCGYSNLTSFQAADKAILLIKWKADITHRDQYGDTVLHSLLACQQINQRDDWEFNDFELNHSLRSQRDLLMLFITAGADVYATNNRGKTPSMTARRCGREKRWIKALMQCGYDYSEVISAGSDGEQHHTRIRQRSKLSFEEYCQRRQEYFSFVEETTDDEDEHNEDKIKDWNEDSRDNAKVDRKSMELTTKQIEVYDGHSEDTCLKRFTGRSIIFEPEGASGNVIDGLFEDSDKQEVEAAYSEDNTLKGIDLSLNDPLAISTDIGEFFDIESYFS